MTDNSVLWVLLFLWMIQTALMVFLVIRVGKSVVRNAIEDTLKDLEFEMAVPVPLCILNAEEMVRTDD